MDRIEAPRTLTEQTFEILLDAICTGQLSPGERLSQDQIAARLNVSRQPVNSALTILKAHRLVEDTGRRGLVVAPIDRRLCQSIYEVRMVLEPLAVRLAVARMTPADHARGRAIIAEARAHLGAEDLSGLIRADIAFHRLIYDLSDNPVIVDCMVQNWHHMRRSMAELMRHPGATDEVWTDHEAILDAMAAADAPRAEAAMRTHIGHARDRVMGGGG